ncbi:hypothetical protein IFM89_004092 [Coptis chinensis]|uniref:Uncharacterized protein n=1 Tax=Coptis chinensis TaxID=261450 RepID=A0A835IW15_9MAGN|nr:hypothetical protein IFM89_004092 [Coptis chinensis]
MAQPPSLPSRCLEAGKKVFSIHNFKAIKSTQQAQDLLDHNKNGTLLGMFLEISYYSRNLRGEKGIGDGTVSYGMDDGDDIFMRDRGSAPLSALGSSFIDLQIYMLLNIETLILATRYGRKGNANDPFLEAHVRELAKQKPAVKRVHPTLHLPSMPQPSTLGAGLFSSRLWPITSNTQRTTIRIIRKWVFTI